MELNDISITPSDGQAYALYAPENIADSIDRAFSHIRDVRVAVGLSKESKRVLLDQACDHLVFLKKVMRDSMDDLKGVKFKMYCEPGGDTCAAEEGKCDESGTPCDCCKSES